MDNFLTQDGVYVVGRIKPLGFSRPWEMNGQKGVSDAFGVSLVSSDKFGGLTESVFELKIIGGLKEEVEKICKLNANRRVLVSFRTQLKGSADKQQRIENVFDRDCFIKVLPEVDDFGSTIKKDEVKNPTPQASRPA